MARSERGRAIAQGKARARARRWAQYRATHPTPDHTPEDDLLFPGRKPPEPPTGLQGADVVDYFRGLALWLGIAAAGFVVCLFVGAVSPRLGNQLLRGFALAMFIGGGWALVRSGISLSIVVPIVGLFRLWNWLRKPVDPPSNGG